MAFPFGGHPTLDQYVAWAREKHGFEVRSGSASDSTGRSHFVTRIFKAGGPSVVVTGLKLGEHLVPSMVGYLDRRLKLTSPWFSIDDGGFVEAEEATIPEKPRKR